MCVSFVDPQFDPKEEEILDHILISGKQFKILNRKLNSLLQLHADAKSRHNVTGIEVDVILKAQESRLKSIMDHMDKNNELWVIFQFEMFNSEVKDLRTVSKERHLLFVQAIKKVQEDVNLKIEELRQEMMKEIAKADQNYYNLHTKVDIITDAVTKLVEYHTSLNSKEFVHLQSVLAEVKEMISKLAIPPTSTISQESISLLFSSLES